MNNGIVELSTGHVFATGSVKVVGPLEKADWAEDSPPWFSITGVGFSVVISPPCNIPDNRDVVGPRKQMLINVWENDINRAAEALRQEAIRKLLGGSLT